MPLDDFVSRRVASWGVASYPLKFHIFLCRSFPWTQKNYNFLALWTVYNSSLPKGIPKISLNTDVIKHVWVAILS